MDFRLLLGVASVLLEITTITAIAQAQITPDGSLNTTVTQSGLNTIITNGTTAGTNLFHSFGQFSVPTGGSATFDLNATPAIRTIFSRVTGGSVSNIDGLIRTTNPASLFLINPAGIVFGRNAQLNIGGSFVGTTATRIKFVDGAEFSAVDPPSAALLTISTPVGLQFNGGTGGIQVQGNGNDGIVPTMNPGIVGSPGQTIALVGGDVNFTAGVITAPAGRIEIGAVERGLVNLIPTPAGWQLGYTQVQALGEVSLTTRSSLWNPYPVGNLAGGIQVVGREITLNQSQIVAATAGSGQGGNITVNAQRSLSLAGLNPNAGAPSAWIVNQVAQGAPGNGGGVNIQAGQLSLQDGAGIETLSFGSGAAGNVQVQANTIFANGTVPVNSPLLPLGISSSHISSSAYASGAGGDVAVTAQQITLTESAQIATTVLPGATGQGGTITVNAPDITAIGYSSLSFTPSGIQAYTLGLGNGGGVNISTDRLTLSSSGGVFTATARFAGVPGTGIGNAGNTTVTAREAIALAGSNPVQPDLVSFLGSLTVGVGNSGNVVVTTPKLSLQSGAGFGTATLSVLGKFGDRTQANNVGNAGNVLLNAADQIEVSGVNPFTQTPSPLGSYTFSNGNGGNVLIQTNRLRVREGGSVTAVTESTGNAATLTIWATDILVEGQASQRSSIVASAPILNQPTREFYGLPDVPTGDTGTVTIATDRLTVRNQGTISVQHQGTGNAGQLAIQAKTVLLEDGSIEAITASGQGGSINLQVQNTLMLRQGSNITATAGGDGNGGNVSIAAQFIIGAENSDVFADAMKGRGGNIQITTQGIFGLQFRPQRTPQNDITASSEFGVSGTVQINNLNLDPSAGVVELPVELVDPTQQIATGCNTQRSRFVATGRGGLPMNPTEQAGSDRPWNDIRAISSTAPSLGALPPDRSRPKILEVSRWRINSNGTIELVAGQVSQTSTLVTCAIDRR